MGAAATSAMEAAAAAEGGMRGKRREIRGSRSCEDIERRQQAVMLRLWELQQSGIFEGKEYEMAAQEFERLKQ